MLRWYVVSAHSGREFEAEQRIREQGFEAWCPYVMRRIFYDGTRSREIRSVFYSRYLFARFDITVAGWPKISNTRGVTGILGSPTAIADEAVGIVRELIGGWRGLMSGDRVKIKSGAFAGCEGLFSQDEDARCRVLLSLLGREVNVEVDVSEVQQL